MMYVPLRWRRYSVRKELREWTPRRVAAAERAVKREVEKVALFPELARWSSVEERMVAMDERSEAFSAQMRQNRALKWREARRRMRWLTPLLRRGFAELWNSHDCPADPEYLLSMIRSTANPWAKLVDLTTLRLHFLKTQEALADGLRPPEWHHHGGNRP